MSTTGRFEVWCDSESDRQLLLALGQISPVLREIESIQVLPNQSFEALSGRLDLSHVSPLVEYDRPDLMIFYSQRPVMVVEITEHGYTGDNPLQRFARAARCAELGVPFVHFTPFARTRLDELLESDEPTSARQVSSRLFDGFMKLSRIYQVPIIGVNWPVDERGLPQKADLREPRQLREVFGEVVDVIETICVAHVEDVISGTDFRDDARIAGHIRTNARLAARSNLRTSEVRLIDRSYGEVIRLLQEPSYLFDLIGEEYFMKGKDHKLIAYNAIRESRIECMESTQGNMIPLPEQAEQIESMLPGEFADKPWVVLYNGYEWRGQPNGGIAANAEVLLCRSEGGRSVREKDRFLAVVWPRVFWKSNSARRWRLLSDLEATVSGDETSELHQLIARKRARRDDASDRMYLAYKPKSIGAWREGTSITRIYRNFCDLIVLNDAVLLGSHRQNGPAQGPHQPLLWNPASREGGVDCDE